MKKENIYKKVKLNEKNRVDENTKSYRISIKKYVSLAFKGMNSDLIDFNDPNYQNVIIAVSELKKETEARYGDGTLLYDKKIAKKIGKYFFRCPSFYKGELENGKANGWGIELLQYTRSTMTNFPLHTIIQFYEGEWKNGKRNGYGELYNYHPSIGFAHQYELEGEVIQMYVEQDEPGIVYKGNWVNGVMEGEGILTIGSNSRQSGLFKNGKFLKKNKK
jgi:hypothetical protein